MKLIFLIAAIITFSPLATSAAPSNPAKLPPNDLTEAKADIERNLSKANTKLTALTRKLAAKLAKSEADAFLRSQASWIAWRDADAIYMAHRYAPTAAASPEIMTLAFNTVCPQTSFI